MRLTSQLCPGSITNRASESNQRVPSPGYERTQLWGGGHWDRTPGPWVVNPKAGGRGLCYGVARGLGHRWDLPSGTPLKMLPEKPSGRGRPEPSAPRRSMPVRPFSARLPDSFISAKPLQAGTSARLGEGSLTYDKASEHPG